MDMKIENRGGRMTEQEAIEILSLDEKEKKLLKNLTPVYEVAIKALEEVEQYRAIGTVEEFRKCMDILNKSEVNELSRIIDEWILYHKIGTPEE